MSLHVPVLAAEVLEVLRPRPGMIIVDGTLGGGGHTRLLAERVVPGGQVISLDRDLGPVEAIRANKGDLPIRAAQANYVELPQILASASIAKVDGILLDIGLSSDQLADANRGFSFQEDGPLDMRFDTSEGRSAAQIVAYTEERELADLIYQFGEERYSRRIAKKIVETRRREPILTTHALAELVRSCVPRSADSQRIHPATRTFQALRIAVNDELGSLQRALRDLPDVLSPRGRLAIISFHSLEDRLVKEAFRSDARLAVITKKPIVANEQESADNPRSRSAKLRVAERV